MSLLGRTRKRRRLAANDDDLRPMEYRNLKFYNSYVNSMVTTYNRETSKDLSYRYLRTKADVRGALHDHNYLALPFYEYWVDDSNKVCQREQFY